MPCTEHTVIVWAGYAVNVLYNGAHGWRQRGLFGDKRRTKQFCRQHGIPVPSDDVLPDDRVVLKPCCATRGDGIQIGRAADLLGVAEDGTLKPPPAGYLVEAFVTGLHYRVIVMDGEVIGATLRTPAAVTGDGKRTLRELIAAASTCATPACDKTCSRQLSTVPAAGETIQLNDLSNFAKGGSVTPADHIDDTVRALCRHVFDVTGVRLFGIDLITPDIARPVASTTAINELELFNDIDIHFVLRDVVWDRYVALAHRYTRRAAVALHLLLAVIAVAVVLAVSYRR
jgi:D-alanine-D-alanine ligase-like ATP-grasp enzyme